MIDTAVPTALSGVRVGGLTVLVAPDRAAAEDEIEPERADAAATAGFSTLRAESCRRVLTTGCQHEPFKEVGKRDLPQIGFVPVAVMIPAITAALR